MKVLRIIARLNVGGPARHVVWLTAGMKPDGYETILVSGVVPPGEDDMSYVATRAGVEPLVLAEMSREISVRDAITVWKIFRLMLREKPNLVLAEINHVQPRGTFAGSVGQLARYK